MFFLFEVDIRERERELLQLLTQGFAMVIEDLCSLEPNWRRKNETLDFMCFNDNLCYVRRVVWSGGGWGLYA